MEIRYQSANRRGSSSRLREESAVHRSGVRQAPQSSRPLTVIFEARILIQGPVWSRCWKTTTQGAGQRSLGLTSLRGVSWQPSATSIRGCLPMREFASLGVIPDQGTTVAVRTAAVSVLKEQVLQKHWEGPGDLWRRALLSDDASGLPFKHGPGHRNREDAGKRLPRSNSGSDSTGRPTRYFRLGPRSAFHPDYREVRSRFDRRRCVRYWCPSERLPFRDFAAEEFIGGHVLTCRGPGGCRSIFQGSTLTLGQMADALPLCWRGGGVDTEAKPAR